MKCETAVCPYANGFDTIAKNFDELNEDQIVYWRDHLDVFLEECFGLKLEPYQKIWLRQKLRGNDE